MPGEPLTGLDSVGCGPLRQADPGGQSSLRLQTFGCVRAAGRIPRVEAARQLGVSPASVTAAVADLLSAGLLEEVETPPRDGHRGRPPVALAVRGAAAVFVGLKLADDLHSGVVVDLAGRVLAEATQPSTVQRRPLEVLLGETEALLGTLLSAAGLTRMDITCIGIGLPGSVVHATGWVFWSPILAERDVDFRARATARLGIPVTIDNDANMVTLAELWFGAGRSKSDFAVVTIEQGVGMGMVIDNALYRGAHGLAMELGHIKVQLDGALCRCGQRGCLEAYLADYALVREAATALSWPPSALGTGPILLESLFDEAKAGNEAARMIFRRAGRYLAVALANVANLFDPSLIILAGERMRYDYLYAESVLAEMRQLTMSGSGSAPAVEINAWGGLVWARGAAALALSDATPEVVARQGEVA